MKGQSVDVLQRRKPITVKNLSMIYYVGVYAVVGDRDNSVQRCQTSSADQTTREV